MQNIKPVQKFAKYEMKPVQYTGFIFCTFFETIFCYFEINGYFHFLGGGGGWGWVAVEVILEGFISGIESFHIIYFYFF